MREPKPYDPVLSGQATAYLVSLSRVKQKTVIALVFNLAKSPSLVGDYFTTDDAGRRLENLALNDWQITFWADHSAGELRITEITEV